MAGAASDPIVERLRAALSDRYEIGGELGRGGNARILRGRDRRDGRLVAVKTLRPEIARAIGPDRFLREIDIARGLDHPHIVPLLDSDESAGILWYAMPLIEGGSLRTLLARDGQLSLPLALRITADVVVALDYAHARRIVHRDLAPGNILNGSAATMVTDFGVARAIDAAARQPLTESGIVVGTPAYTSPEQARDAKRVDGRADLYGLGCVLYEMLAGAPPFHGATPQAVLARHLSDPVPPLRTVRPDVPPPLEQLVGSMLAKDPADRPQTAAALGRTLRDLGGEPTARA